MKKKKYNVSLVEAMKEADRIRLESSKLTKEERAARREYAQRMVRGLRNESHAS